MNLETWKEKVCAGGFRIRHNWNEENISSPVGGNIEHLSIWKEDGTFVTIALAHAHDDGLEVYVQMDGNNVEDDIAFLNQIADSK